MAPLPSRGRRCGAPRAALCRPLLLLATALALFARSCAAVAWNWSEYWESVAFHSGIGYQCMYVEKPSQSVRDHLNENLKGQERAIDAVVGAIEAWEFSRLSVKDREPMVLAITGPTGTGKTELSNLLAESLFKRKRKLANSEKWVPTGLLIFRGEDFSDNFTNPITEYHTQIKTRLADHLHRCAGQAVVVIDEVQKVIPHTLDVLMEAVSSSSQFTYYKNGVSKQIDTSNVIFVLVSDIGVTDMEHVMIQYESRADVPMAELEKVVKAALDAQWKRLNFGKMIDQVIPFLPFEQEHIVDIIALKLKNLDRNYRGKYWRQLSVEPGIADFMSRLDSVHYEVRSAKIDGQVTSSKIFAKYGARDVETGPIQLLKSKLLRYLRPFNPDAEVRISQDPISKEIAIVSCAVSPTEKPRKSAAVESDKVVDVEVQADGTVPAQQSTDELTCVTKWQGRFE